LNIQVKYLKSLVISLATIAPSGIITPCFIIKRNFMRRIFVPLVVGLAVGSLADNAVAERTTPLEKMIAPVSNPVNFEDPRIESNLRPIFIYHEIDKDFVTGGGDVQLYALQARFALTDDIALIATKDGYIDANFHQVVPSDSGLANIAAGLKYAAWRNEDSSQMASVGLRYEIPLGDEEVLQGNGDGMINPFISYAGAFENLNVIAGLGTRVRLDNDDSSFLDADLHIDYPMCDFFPLLEVNLVHVLSAGNRLPIADEGFDLFNFGSSEADGKTVVTGSVGGRYRISDSLDFGAAYQFPLTQGEGSNLTKWRVTTDLIYNF
jgi:hypothetical protein